MEISIKKTIFWITSLAFAMTAVFFFNANQAAASAIPTVPNNLGLMGYWSLDDGVGSQATDFSGRGHTGTLNSFTLSGSTSNWITGKISKALAFDGTDDVVTTGSDLGMSGDSAVTVSAWVNATSLSSQGTIAGLISGTSFGASSILLNNNGAGSVGFHFSSCGEDTASGVITTGGWHHIVVTKTPGAVSTNVSIYVDGVSKSHSNFSSNCTPNITNARFNIGSGWDNTDTTFPFSGSIDDVRIYNRAFSLADVTAIYNRTQIARIKDVGSGLVGYWSMDDGVGSQATDFSGKGNTGTLTGAGGLPTWAAGRSGKALAFDGTDDYVDVGSPAALQLQAFSTSFWYKGSQTPDNNDTFLSYARHNGANENGWSLRIDEAGNPGKIWLDISDSPAGMTNFSSINDGNWHHVVVANHAVDDHRIYIDGAIDVINTTTVSSINYTSAKFYIGARLGAFGSVVGYMPGTIDDVRVYNRALAEAEVAAIYKAGTIRISSSQNTQLTKGLVGMWDFNGLRYTSSSAADSSVSSNHGTPTGSSGAQNKPQPINGPIGQAVHFDGSDDYIGVTGSTLNTIEPSGSISAWFAFDATWNSGRTADTYLWESEKNATYNQIYLRFAPSDGRLSFGKNASDIANTPEEILSVTSSWNAKQWYHVVFVWEGTAMRIYVNGALDNSGTKTSGINSVADVARIGNHRVGNLSFPGSIDDFRIYNRALDSSEVIQLYNQGK